MSETIGRGKKNQKLGLLAFSSFTHFSVRCEKSVITSSMPLTGSRSTADTWPSLYVPHARTSAPGAGGNAYGAGRIREQNNARYRRLQLLLQRRNKCSRRVCNANGESAFSIHRSAEPGATSKPVTSSGRSLPSSGIDRGRCVARYLTRYRDSARRRCLTSVHRLHARAIAYYQSRTAGAPAAPEPRSAAEIEATRSRLDRSANTKADNCIPIPPICPSGVA